MVKSGTENYKALYNLALLLMVAGAEEGIEAIFDNLSQFLELFADAKDCSVEVPGELADKIASKLADNYGIAQPFHWELEFPEVFAHYGGFDAIVANPPFIGDRDLRGQLKSTTLVNFLANYFIPEKKKSDYAGFFFWRFHQILNASGVVGSLATNTIAQASNRTYVTKPLTIGPSPHFRIFRAVPTREWPGEAKVHFAALHLSRSSNTRTRIIGPDFSQRSVVESAQWLPAGRTISSYLDPWPDFDLKPLFSVSPRVIQGFILRGNFSIHRQPGESLVEAIEAIPINERDALAAYLNAEAVQQEPRPTPPDIVIDFYEPLLKAGLADANAATQLAWLEAHYPVTLNQLQTPSPHAPDQECIYDQRAGLESSSSNDAHKEFWWLYGSVRQGLRKDWQDVAEVTILPRATKIWVPSNVKKDFTFSTTTLRLCPIDASFIAAQFTMNHFAVISSFLFEMLTRRVCSTLKSDLRFTPTEIIPYFPWPWQPELREGRLTIGEAPGAMARELGEAIDKVLALRTSILEEPEKHGLVRKQVGGPTDLYNLYDADPRDTTSPAGASVAAIEQLRQAHVALMQAVLRAYGWHDLAGACAREHWVFDHPWIDRTQRFVPPKGSRVEILARIARLNNERYAQESQMIKDLQIS